LGLSEFLDSDQQIWQLRMTDGDAWTGLTKVYRVLQSTSCTPNYSTEGQCTVLKLKRLLSVNRMINSNALLVSMETPHLLMLACETNQPVNDEVENILQELLNILKQKFNMKIILTTQTENDTTDFKQEIATEMFHVKSVLSVFFFIGNFITFNIWRRHCVGNVTKNAIWFSVSHM